MCGIFASFINNDMNVEKLRECGMLCNHRGPDNTSEIFIKINETRAFMMFHRLAINGLDDSGNQPMTIHSHPKTILMCNGEIYNFKQLAIQYNISLTTGSDCEIIIHLYHLLGIEGCISSLEGVFSFIIYDREKNEVVIGHDPMGVRSLYWVHQKDQCIISSEMKCIHELNKNVKMYPPGCYSVLNMETNELLYHKEYYSLRYENQLQISNITFTEDTIVRMIKEKLIQSVNKRLLSERPIGCLLSGGIDSSIIACIVSRMIRPNKLRTFSIGLKGSRDLECARKVALHLDTNHTEVIVTEQEMINAIEPTIKQIESYDTTTVRASTPMYLLSKYISENTDISVIFSGEGADEISGSYLYFHNAPNPQSFQVESLRLLKDIQYFDVLRGDKTTAGNGLEIRVPFLDKDFVRFYMNIDPELKIPRKYNRGTYEKYLLRKAFEGCLPEEIIWRRKDGFSDSVSSNEKLWYEIIQEHTNQLYPIIDNQYIHLKPKDSEQLWYREIFTKYYRYCDSIVPYFWLPKWTTTDNPSGREIICPEN